MPAGWMPQSQREDSTTTTSNNNEAVSSSSNGQSAMARPPWQSEQPAASHLRAVHPTATPPMTPQPLRASSRKRTAAAATPLAAAAAAASVATTPLTQLANSLQHQALLASSSRRQPAQERKAPQPVGTPGIGVLTPPLPATPSLDDFGISATSMAALRADVNGGGSPTLSTHPVPGTPQAERLLEHEPSPESTGKKQKQRMTVTMTMAQSDGGMDDSHTGSNVTSKMPRAEVKSEDLKRLPDYLQNTLSIEHIQLVLTCIENMVSPAENRTIVSVPDIDATIVKEHGQITLKTKSILLCLVHLGHIKVIIVNGERQYEWLQH